jgi:hypothetical protein
MKPYLTFIGWQKWWILSIGPLKGSALFPGIGEQEINSAVRFTSLQK